MARGFARVLMVFEVSLVDALRITSTASAAQTIGPALPLSVSASNVGATVEPGEPDIYTNDVESSIWFKWVAPAAQTNVINLCGSGFTGSDSPFEKFAIRTSFAGAPVAEQ